MAEPAGDAAFGRLAGKVAVVTGAGRGIGREVARAFGREGAAVVVVDLGAELDGTGRSSSPAEETAAAIAAQGGIAEPAVADVGNRAEADEVVASTLTRFGRLDILVNAAGNHRRSLIEEADEDEWATTLRVHVQGTVNMTAGAAAHWRSAARGGRLLNFGSDAGLYGLPENVSYATAKGAVTAFTLSCAQALSRFCVTANVVIPQAATRITLSIPAEERPDPERWETGEFDPANVAPALVYLASDAGGWVNGCIVGAWGYEVHLYSKPDRERSIFSHGPWDSSVLSARFEQAFRGKIEARRR